MAPGDQAVLVLHQPIWLVSWFWGHRLAPNLLQLVRGPLAGRARIALAGARRREPDGAGWRGAARLLRLLPGAMHRA